jgi:hypothetical protein
MALGVSGFCHVLSVTHDDDSYFILLIILLGQ